MSFPRYPEYKDSGVQWLGEVPAHWKIEKLKFLFKRVTRDVAPDDGIVTCFRDGEVTLRKNRRTEGFTNALKEIGYQGIRKGDLVIHAMDAFAGAIGVSDSNGKASPVYSVCVPRKSGVEPSYYGFQLRNMALTGFVESLAKGIRERSTDFRWNDAGEVVMPVPTHQEQDRITSFLNHETGKIDALIEEQRRLIELLKEKRQAVISHAVTKGLDPNVPMKDSGVEWLGEVPAHWDVVPLRRAVECIQTGGTPSQDSFEEEPKNGIPWFTPRDFGDDLSLNSARKSVSHESILGGESKVFPSLSVLIVGIGATLGKVSISESEFSANQQINVVIPSPHVSGRFLAYSLSVKAEPMKLLSNASTIGIINQQKTKEIWVCIPPAREQEEIECHLRRITSQIDALLSGAYEAIGLLEERRSGLISAAVTGKIDVRCWSPGAGAEDPELVVVAERAGGCLNQGGAR